MSEQIIEAKNISKYFHDPVKVKVLKRGFVLNQQGEFVSITGKSGCGKSTLLYILSTMDTDYEGICILTGNCCAIKNETSCRTSAIRKLASCSSFTICYQSSRYLKM